MKEDVTEFVTGEIFGQIDGKQQARANEAAEKRPGGVARFDNREGRVNLHFVFAVFKEVQDGGICEWAFTADATPDMEPVEGDDCGQNCRAGEPDCLWKRREAGRYRR